MWSFWPVLAYWLYVCIYEHVYFNCYMRYRTDSVFVRTLSCLLIIYTSQYTWHNVTQCCLFVFQFYNIQVVNKPPRPTAKHTVRITLKPVYAGPPHLFRWPPHYAENPGYRGGRPRSLTFAHQPWGIRVASLLDLKYRILFLSVLCRKCPTFGIASTRLITWPTELLKLVSN